MNHYITVQESKDILVYTECDNCHKNINVSDILEYQEMVHIKFEGGYNSVFGDGNKYECNICQHCVKALLGSVLRKV